MHDIKWIRENPEEFDLAMSKRNLAPIANYLIDLDEGKRGLISLIQKLQFARNEKTKIIAQMKVKNSSEFNVIKRDVSDIKEKLDQLEEQLNNQTELDNNLSSLPNIPDKLVPVGKDENDNQEIRKFGNVPSFSFTPKEHWEIAENLGYLDFTQTAKMSGSRFNTLKGPLSRLERALANFMLDIHTGKFGYTELSPPFLVRDSAMYGVGQLPKFAEDSFQTTNNYRLIPTAEVSLTNMVADSIIAEQELPYRFTAYSPCFRQEAGSAGRDTRGMFRQHQFNKVELVSITTPEQSEEEHERMTGAAEEILKLLELPYRVMLLCSGDMGFSAKKTYDLEVWLPGQNKYREISSCSNCGDFQARRMKARYRSQQSKETVFVHTLNGSGLAIGRTIIAIIENYQNEDGSINIPEILVPYMGGIRVIK